MAQMVALEYEELLTLQRVLYFHCTKKVDEPALDMLRRIEAILDELRPGWRQM